MKLSEIINLLPTVRHQRDRIAELEAELARVKADPRLRLNLDDVDISTLTDLISGGKDDAER